MKKTPRLYALFLFGSVCWLAVFGFGWFLRNSTATTFQELAFWSSLVTALLAGIFILQLRSSESGLRLFIDRLREFEQNSFRGRLRVPESEAGILFETINRLAVEIETSRRVCQQEKKFLDSVLDNLNEGVLILDQQGRLVRSNHRASRILGLASSLPPLPQLDALALDSTLQKTIRSVLSGATGRTVELVLGQQDPQEYQVHTSQLMDTLGHPAGALVIFENMSAVMEAERTQEDFLSNISHELKTPLTSIRGFAETLLASGFTDNDQSQHFVRIIAQQSQRLDELVDELMNLARLKRGDPVRELQKENHPLESVVRRAIKQKGAVAAQKQILVQSSFEDKLLAPIHPTLIEHAIANLLDNAIRHSPPSSTVRLRTWTDSQNAYIEVSDQGEGIPKRHQSRIFERFFRGGNSTQDQTEAKGRGLGLALVKSILDAHNGKILVDSLSGQGSAFTMVLPIQPSTPDRPTV